MPAPTPAGSPPPAIQTPSLTGQNASQNSQISGYGAALGNLQNSLNQVGNTTQGAQMQLGQQLAQNQGNVQQNLINKGLGNTTVSQTMQQAPLQTYNQGMANLAQSQAQNYMNVYGQAGNMAAQAGQNVSQMGQPYAQSQVAQGLQNQQNAQQMNANAMNGFNQPGIPGLTDPQSQMAGMANNMGMQTQNNGQQLQYQQQMQQLAAQQMMAQQQQQGQGQQNGGATIGPNPPQQSYGGGMSMTPGFTPSSPAQQLAQQSMGMGPTGNSQNGFTDTGYSQMLAQLAAQQGSNSGY